MKIVVIGGTGRIGSKVVAMLGERGHDAVPAAPHTGVNTMTGEGLAQAVTGADVVIDVSNSPSSDGDAAMKFFQTSTRNVLAAERPAGVRHHVVLSIVGIAQRADDGYFGGKLAQEELTRNSSIPYSIVRATQFFEFIKGIADAATQGNTVRLPPVMFQPMAAEDVARTVCTVALGKPVNGIVETAGPQPFRLDELVRIQLEALKDQRRVLTDPKAPYFGSVLDERTLMPGDDARLGEVTFQVWQQQQQAATRARPARQIEAR